MSTEPGRVPMELLFSMLAVPFSPTRVLQVLIPYKAFYVYKLCGTNFGRPRASLCRMLPVETCVTKTMFRERRVCQEARIPYRVVHRHPLSLSRATRGSTHSLQFGAWATEKRCYLPFSLEYLYRENIPLGRSARRMNHVD